MTNNNTLKKNAERGVLFLFDSELQIIDKFVSNWKMILCYR